MTTSAAAPRSWRAGNLKSTRTAAGKRSDPAASGGGARPGCESLTDGGGHEAVAVEGQVVVGVLGHLGLLVSLAAQGAGGAGVLLAAALGLHCRGRGGKT